MNLDIYILVPMVVLIAGFAYYFGWVMNARSDQKKLGSAEERVKKLLADAEKEATTLKREKLLEVKDEWYRKKQEFDSEANSKRNKLQAFEKQLDSREENIDRKLDLINKKEKEVQALRREVDEKAKEIETKRGELTRVVEEHKVQLERVSGLSQEEAKKMLIENMVDNAKAEAAQALKSISDQAKLDAKKESQKIIVQAIQRTASDHSVENTVSVLNIQNEEMKGRIIGREGRNIRAFEAATGVDVIVDDTPEAVILSGFDPFRREVARQALEKLIADGRIHPARIEEVVDKTKKDLEEEVLRAGEQAFMELGLNSAHPEIVKLVGKMKYRSSYGQNLLAHSIEVAHLTGLMAVELGLDQSLAKRAALMHDVGKTVDRSVEGPHALIGFEIAKKYGEHPMVANAIGSHHEDIPMESPISGLVQAADAISGARPGARRESVEGYIKRLEKLEQLAKSFQGVAKTYAIQAGREIRVIVEPDRIDDAMADQLSRDIASKIQEELQYPGQIKVLVIREVRSVSIAK